MKTLMKTNMSKNEPTFEERYPEHDNPSWQRLTWREEDVLYRAKREHAEFIRKFNDLLIG